jgi:hypothetical protein
VHGHLRPWTKSIQGMDRTKRRYIRFNLPTGGAGMPAQMHRGRITNAVNKWSNTYDIDVSFNTVGYELHLSFQSDPELAQFILTFDEDLGFTKFKTIEM